MERRACGIKPLHEAEDLASSIPEGADQYEAAVLTTDYFTGIRTVVIDGMAHLLFFAQRPSSFGDVEYTIVARLVAPEMRAATILTHAALAIAKGPTAIPRPAN